MSAQKPPQPVEDFPQAVGGCHRQDVHGIPLGALEETTTEVIHHGKKY